MPTLQNAIASWHDFGMLIGTAAAPPIGLLFVAASVDSGVLSADRRAHCSRLALCISVAYWLPACRDRFA